MSTRREPSIATVHEDAVDLILLKCCKLLQCARVHLEHAQMALGYPEIGYDYESEQEAKSLVTSMLEALADELPIRARIAIQAVDYHDIITDHKLECMEIPVEKSAKEKLMEAAK